MTAYVLLFVIPALVAFTRSARPATASVARPIWNVSATWWAVTLALTVIIGWRHEVGGDWNNYLEHWYAAADAPLSEILLRADPGYWLVTWLAADAGFGIHATNLLFALPFSFGLGVFCSEQPRPWLALAAAVPYMVIVLGMGYTRQGVALGFGMIGLVALGRGRVMTFVALVSLGALFHRSAVLLVPLGMLAAAKGRIWITLWIAALGIAMYDSLLRPAFEAMEVGYLQAEYNSEGALIRVAMNVVPAVLLLLLRRRFKWSAGERNLWMFMALLALASMAWLALSPSSTAVDRIALYLIPLQLYLFSRLPDLVRPEFSSGRAVVAAVLLYYAATLMVWLLYATHAQYWIPYRFYPLEDVF
jgi:hypothetical protein